MKKMALTRMLEGDYTSLPPDLTQSLSIAELDKLVSSPPLQIVGYRK